MILFLTDTETTGLETKKHDVIQIAAIISDKFKKRAEINIKCQPTRWDTINDYALKVNNTTREQLKTLEDPKESWRKLYAFMEENFTGEKFIFTGQNAPFDRRHLINWWNTHKDDDAPDFEHYLEDENLDLKPFSVSLNKYGFIQTQKSKKTGKPQNNLKYIVEALGVKVDGELHDALADIKATGNCLYKVLKIVESVEEQDKSHPVVKQFKKWKVLLS